LNILALIIISLCCIYHHPSGRPAHQAQNRNSSVSSANIFIHPRILFVMEIEQRPPNQPNFLLVVLLSAAVLIGIFILAYLFVHFDGRHLGFRHHRANPTSQLVLPAPATTSTFV
jgi:amino acid transporter